ncbi:hypothetical protein KEM55_006713 [Ascosphaera atra]|nr:hypothetical protein KEM55_006713 [Ascosphaera atra]
MHILHPILEENSLRRLVDDFVHNYSLNARGPLAGKPRGLSATNQGRTTKRKRSLEDDGDGQCQSGERTAHSTIHRSIENAIVLLVLALGAICTWKDDLPGFVQDGFNPLQSSPLSPSRKLQRRSQAESPRSHTLRMMPKNVDNIPGMAYYAFASDILGSHEGRTDLPFAQACILAGLYAGQVAHPFTSHAWLSKASRACQMLVRSSNYPLLPDESLHKHLISFAFWTCQQLESDILAELDLPHSGLSRYENIVKFPDPLMVHSISEDTDSTGGQILVLYLTQIVLRNVLNGTHTHLYKADGGNDGVNMPYNKVMTLIRFQKTLSMNLESWRNMLPAELKWNDGDPPSDDINIARMRAKYYGARYIIHRPLLHYALHSFQPGSSNSSALASPASVASTIHGASPKTTVPLAIRGKPTDEPAAKYRTASFGGADIDPSYYERQTMDACRICIESAIHSTTAFDGLVGRPIVTNIFGTAHA